MRKQEHMFMRQTAAFARCGHTWISLRAQKNMFRRKDCRVLTPRAHLDLSPCASKNTCLCDRLLRSHAVGTLGSLSVRKETCSGEKTAAFSRREDSWVSLRAQEDLFMRQHCCVRTLWAHLDLTPCAKRHVLAKGLPRSHAASTLGSLSVCKQEHMFCDRLLRSHAVSTLGSLSVREKTSSGEKTAAFSRREHTWISLRAQSRTHVYATDCCVRTLWAHLDLSPCAKKHVPAKRLPRSHAARIVGSLSVRKQEHMFMRQTAAFARCGHTWISLRAQRNMFLRKDCRVLTPRAHLDLSPCGRPVHATTLLRSYAVGTFGSHSVRKEACSGEKTAAFSRREHTWISLRAQAQEPTDSNCVIFSILY